MPIYEYYCTSCDVRFEKLRPISAAGQPFACPTCGNAAPAAITRPARITGASESGNESAEGETDDFGLDDDFGAAHGHSHSHGPGGHTH
ncbi:MAG TPA: FmdB family zinc ribbon protein [Dehalococcoidia bacterium]|jgi:putative FmdB family regulatory protein|nr:FmdB family zinc ribbon protein [Dehalococcoidia bacterium]